MFLAPWFAIAGLIAAAGPVLIHLLNRRRYRVIHWAAMDFLREAVQNSRRILQIRDILLLVVRTVCILAFALAMARPFLSRTMSAAAPDQPVHAVVLLDNSLSMAYQELDHTLLDTAKQKARQWIEQLPAGSRISVVPLCGSAVGLNVNAYPTTEDALEALAGIEVVDRATTTAQALDLALEACRRVSDMPAKKIVLVGDSQVTSQSVEALSLQLNRLPAPVEMVPIETKDPENAWIADFKLQDDVADMQTPAVFLTTIRYEGPQPRRSVQVTLQLDGVGVATQTVDLVPGQAREIRFPPYRFDVPTTPGRPTFVVAEVAMTHDRLPADDQRFLVVPVVAALPVVFVDQYGPGEDPRRSRYGETYPLRRLLAPITSREDRPKQLIQVRHTTIDRVDRALLEDARLVVIAGTSSPGTAVGLLREYVLQGGSLVIAAGGEFDPAAWTDMAWLDGQGILPAPLKPKFAGRLPDEGTGPLDTFQIDFHSLVHDYFLLEQSSREELEDLYRLPYFFKAAVADLSNEAIAPMIRQSVRQIEGQRAQQAEIDQKIAQLGRGGDAAQMEKARLERQRAMSQANWLLWGMPEAVEQTPPPAAEELAERQRPRALASLTNGVPWLVERRIGQGRVLLCSGGFSTRWSTLSLTNTMLIFDRIFRDMLQRTFPRRNMTTDEQILLPVAAADRMNRLMLTGSGRETPLAVDVLGPDRYGIAIRNITHRGGYRVVATNNHDTSSSGGGLKLWDLPLAVNGPADESNLAVAPRSKPADEAKDSVLVTKQQVEGAVITGITGQDTWRWLMIAALACLLVEIAVLALPSLRREPRP